MTCTRDFLVFCSALSPSKNMFGDTPLGFSPKVETAIEWQMCDFWFWRSMFGMFTGTYGLKRKALFRFMYRPPVTCYNTNGARLPLDVMFIKYCFYAVIIYQSCIYCLISTSATFYVFWFLCCITIWIIFYNLFTVVRKSIGSVIMNPLVKFIVYIKIDAGSIILERDFSNSHL
jgi:hypothetical protein